MPAALTRNKDGHGTHVASIAAGRAAGKFAGGVAPEAKILFVISAERRAIGYSIAHLAALKFINQFAHERRQAGGRQRESGTRTPARTTADPRSRSGSTSSRAVAARPGRIVVKSAGNERGKRGHAKVELLPDSAETLTLEIVDRSRLEPRSDGIVVGLDQHACDSG